MDEAALRGHDIIEIAVSLGGKKLDSYDGNHKFYNRNGFEPVSWCKWDPTYTPPDWNPEMNDPEDIIFYVYKGEKTKTINGNVIECKRNCDISEYVIENEEVNFKEIDDETFNEVKEAMSL